MKKIKIFPKMFIQIFSVLAIIIILVHSLVYFIFPKTYLETRKEKKAVPEKTGATITIYCSLS